MANAAILLSKEDPLNKTEYLSYATMHFNKTMSFINRASLYGNGKKCSGNSLPESYNIIVKNKDWWHLSSPIDPLN
jgi:hypothetical protein